MTQPNIPHLPKVDESISVLDKIGQNTDGNNIINTQSINFQQFENISYQKGNIQNDIEALKSMQDKLKQYISCNHSQNQNQLNIITGSNQIKFNHNGVTVNKSKDKYIIQSENPFFKENNLVLRYSLSIDSVICSIQYNPTGSMFAFADGRTVFYINSKDGAINGTCKIPIANSMENSLYTRSICFSHDSRYLAISSVDHQI